MKAAPAAVYVHLPWCVRKCPYCDFNSYEARGAVDADGYVDALLRDCEAEAARAPFEPTSVFIGGGTPSLFPGEAVARLLEGLARRAPWRAPIEVTLEANPGASDAARFRAYREAGVHRLSIGVQSFDDAKLAALGRVHDGEAARDAIRAARDAGFKNLNLDLMFGLPGDAPGDSDADLAAALAFEPEHLSWYQLTLEPGTAFAHRPPALPAHDAVADAWETGLARLADAGYEHYETSAHARGGRVCAHNVNYWAFGDYVGLGAGAHGKRTIAGRVLRTAKPRHPASYVAAVSAEPLEPAGETHTVPAAMLATEFMMNALRLRGGFTLAAFERATGLARAALAAPLASACERGLLERLDGDRVRPTALGFRFQNELQLLFTSAPETADA